MVFWQREALRLWASAKHWIVRCTREKVNQVDLQLFEGGFDVRKLEEDCFIWDPLVVEHETDTPHCRRETFILGTRQVVEYNF